MSGAHSRNKGCRFERQVANALKVIGIHADRTAQIGKHGADDVQIYKTVIDPMGAGLANHYHMPIGAIECKHIAKIAACRFLDQAVSDGKDPPIVVMREDKGKPIVMFFLDDAPKVAELYATARGVPTYPRGDG